jgi:glutamine amidotransferase-like uncharacterized protein
MPESAPLPCRTSNSKLIEKKGIEMTLSRTFFLFCFSLLVGCSPIHAAPHKDGRIVVIFQSPTTCSDCASSLGEQMKKKGFEVKYVGPGESTQSVLKNATMYMVPGGEDCEASHHCWTASDRDNIKRYVQNGGIYFGVCLGAYWAGDWPGVLANFEPLHISGAHVLEFTRDKKEKESRLEQVIWNGKKIWTYFQDGPAFLVDRDKSEPTTQTKVIATYVNPVFVDENKKPTVAAFITHYGKGVVGVSGVHLEGPIDWHLEPTVKQKLDELKISPAEFTRSTNFILSQFIDQILATRQSMK